MTYSILYYERSGRSLQAIASGNNFTSSQEAIAAVALGLGFTYAEIVEIRPDGMFNRTVCTIHILVD